MSGAKSSASTIEETKKFVEMTTKEERRLIDKEFVLKYLQQRRNFRRLILEDVKPENSSKLILGIPIELFHHEITPWKFMHLYLSGKERRFLWKLLETGDYEEALRYARFRYQRNDIMSRTHVIIAIIRCAPLALTPKISAQIMMPLIVQKRIEIALNGKDRDSLTAMQEISDLISMNPIKRSVVLHGDLKDSMELKDEERPWLRVPAPAKLAAITATPHEIVERKEEEISKAAEAEIEAAFEVPKS